MITRQQAVRYAAVLLALLASGRAQGQGGGSYTEIQGTGQSLYRIAVPPVLDDGGAAPQAQVATQVMTRDLKLYGLFKVLDPKGFLADLAKEGTGIDASAWANAGAQAVIKARASARGIEFFLYEVGKGARPVLQRHYLGDGKQARRMAHQFGDEVVRHLTGERGIFTTKLAFAAGNRRAGVSHIYVMDYDGYGVTRVSRTGQQNVSPSLGPGGLLAYTSFLWKNPDLFVMPLGGRANRISRQPGLNTAAAWAPGGGRLAVTLSKDGNSEIYVISATGQVLKRLTHNAAIDTSPTWSPDGSQLAFVSNRGG
ncbi:MAG: PD40 domain-containing protein, partial [Deltaproteobacteria bacterium]|nr:PD40 domain-containing protein [Deltaproteobacteria bacterium]